MRRLLVVTCVVFFGSCSRDGADVPTAPSSPSQQVSSGELTFAAGTMECSDLPSEIRTRSFSVRSDGFIWRLGGSTFLPTTGSYTWNTIYSSDTYIGFNDPPIWESIGSDGYLVIYGQVEGRGLLTASSVPFWARFEYCPSREPGSYPKCKVPVTTCQSANHQLLLRWR
jgi:hypothetical protein